MNFLEELVAEWYEFEGYLIHKNIRFGKRPQGGYTGEMDVVAFHPREKSMIHIETSTDSDSWEKRIRKFKKKFDNAAEYYQEEFNFKKKEIQKIAIVGFSEKSLRPQTPIEILLNNGYRSPGQIRGFNTGPEQVLRLAQALEGRMQESFEMTIILRDTVGQRALEVGPDEFRRVEFRGVTRKAVDVQSGMSGKKNFDRASLVRLAVIPEQDHRPPQVLEQMAEKSRHLGGADVLVAMEMGIEGELPAPGRDGERGDRGNFMPPPSGDPQLGRAAAGRPGADPVGDQQKPALIEESEMGAKLFGFFLSGARRNVSSGQSPSRPVPAPAFPAFGNSSPGGPSASRGWPPSSESQTAPRSLGPPASGSRGRSGSRRPAPPATEFFPIVSSFGEKGVAVARGSVGGGAPLGLVFGRPDATAPPNSATRPLGLPSPEKSFLTSVKPWLSACAFPTFPVGHGVSCPLG